MQDILGADVVANRAVGHCGVEQRGESGGAESLQEAAGQPGEGRVPRVQRRGESAFGREQFGEPVDPLGECFGRLVRGTQGRARDGDGVDPLSTTALTRSERCGKCRYSVPTPTPAGYGSRPVPTT